MDGTQALAVTGFASQDAELARACYRSMAVIGAFAIVPLSVATLLSGLVEALSTRCGLVRHWWVLVKFLLTTVSALILWQHMAVLRMATFAVDSPLSAADFRAQRLQLLLHSVGGLLVLLTTTALSIYKPWGMTRFVRHPKVQTSRPAPQVLRSLPERHAGLTSSESTP